MLQENIIQIFHLSFCMIIVIVKVGDKLLGGWLQFGIIAGMDLIKGLEEKIVRAILVHWGNAKVLHNLVSHHFWERFIHPFHLRQERVFQLYHVKKHVNKGLCFSVISMGIEIFNVQYSKEKRCKAP